jgi:hypothetical protein
MLKNPKLYWKIAMISSCIGSVVFVLLNVAANGAPQQAAGSAMAIGLAVIPYVLARAVQELNKD